MKHTIYVPQEIDIRYVVVTLPVRDGEEDIPADFPLRQGDKWQAVIDIDTGRIHDWPIGTAAELSMNVCDSGCYILWDAERREVARIEDYVPHGLIPGKYGDYVDLKIDANGIIAHWPQEPDLSEFFPKH
jgi:hypothetical protein